MMLAIWDDGVWQNVIRLVVVVGIAYLLVMWLAALVWTYRDIASRTRDPFMQTLSVGLVAVFNLPGLLLYLILRPKDTLADTYDRQLEAEALLQELQDQSTCPACRRRVSDDFLSCPYCRAALRTPCAECGRALAFGWVSCPFCGAERTAAERAPVHQGPAAAVQPEGPPTAPASASGPSHAQRTRRPSTARYTPQARKAPPGADAAASTSTPAEPGA